MRFPFVMLFTATLLGAGPQGSQPVFRTDVHLVTLFATVSDSAGRRVWNLDQDSFVVYEDGVRQDIRIFERQPDTPLSIALLLDTSISTKGELGRERGSAKRFVRAVLGGDLSGQTAIALYAFDWKVIRKAAFSADIGKLERALWFIRGTAGTALYDAIRTAAQDLQLREGRRAIVVVSDGVDTVSRGNFAQAEAAAKGINCPIFAVIADPAGDIAGEHTLLALAADTGGAVFRLASARALETAFRDLADRFAAQYILGYYRQPSRGKPPQVHVDLAGREGTASVRLSACGAGLGPQATYTCGGLD